MEDKIAKGPCRDFERGVCNRGNRCKFYHPENVPQPGNNKLPICKDFQNKGCDRHKCKFLHVTVEEEATYNTTGILPAHGGRPDKVAASGSVWSGTKAGAPLSKDRCKDFLNGVCDRRNCKFAHVNEEPAYPPTGYGKRRRDDYGMTESLMEDNEMLRRKITDLQRQVIDLREMNDTLYDQNTRYRNQLRGPTPSAASLDPYAKPLGYPAPATSSDPYAMPSSTAYAIPSSTSYDGFTKF